ncbi:multiple coagulation factor deficiency protein 2 homolog [Saccostrea echinata]|uniref:multiple coagulation factor deficiency protein 2 homolog n=1 Tax=Saccostrea echinata TaxID=191078 RepID=UPI002A81C85D|nr:multiple coagulation factor deficiency protein 2 homolog [Saccostrea echinata]XP_061194686.1 multiple coagulation factor deficiency protein 2 homolog [Saccostrea echinata]
MLRLFLLLSLAVWCCHGHGNHGQQGGTQGQPVPADQFNFHDPKISQDEAHLKEHLKDQIDTNKRMTPEEMEFHYFRLHDTNNDTKLDGLEIMAALHHMGDMFKLQPQEKIGKTPEQIAALEEERQKGALKYFTDIIDRVLVTDDVNRDGYISYPEYMNARKRDFHQYQQQMAMQQQQMAQMQAAQFQQFQQFQQYQQQQAQMAQQQQQKFQQQPNQNQLPNAQQFQQQPQAGATKSS